MTSNHPACCSPFDATWPFPEALPGVVMHSCRFDPALLAADDFPRSAIAAPANIQRSVAKRQAEFLAGRLCARSALLALTGRADVPALGEDRAPVWPAGISGSISHSHGLATALVASNTQWRGLGLDLEERMSAERALRLAKEILTPAELQRLDGLTPEQKAERITLAFSIKESLFKALYPLVRKRFYFHDAEMLDCDGARARLRLLIDLSGEWKAGSELDGWHCLFQDRVLSLVAIQA
ncbi:4'-phosphopantetheinyl transferase superfamily protein [Pseudomonas sp. JM0905a]|uniref:Enterobactin synthase component D n=1 Tax=Metapseudomonas resinovorans TaxID=53412 RepID=A0ABT4YBS8_METRE|nr:MULTISPECIES: 4'-phosphopantetheinyl transferase superfamily protein [Pseudomonas]MBD2839203.1 4'-phosphopantetheinyl transferase superfamily protein [Pseudomonas sp. JM0905a]MDA8486330.1 4'-phosphopantetheinyl transferase superfamily protein [Pseudomonas resinovorans]